MGPNERCINCTVQAVSQQQLVVERNGGKFRFQGDNIWDTFDLVLFKVILESFDALVSKSPVT